jgi:serine/threonine protein kinase
VRSFFSLVGTFTRSHSIRPFFVFFLFFFVFLLCFCFVFALFFRQIKVVLQFCSKGSLETLFGQGKLDWEQKIRIMKGIASGLQFLHDCKIVHRDLAARNILLSDGMEPRITFADVLFNFRFPRLRSTWLTSRISVLRDFGMSRMLEETQKQGTTKSDIGYVIYVSLPSCVPHANVRNQQQLFRPIRWMSPESLSHLEYSTASDIFSLAVVFYELAAESIPFADLDLIAVGAGVRDGHLRLTMPPDTPSWLSALCERCWSQSPSDRPKISEICDVFLQHQAPEGRE